MKFLNAWTLEVDEPSIAIAEILDQLDLEHNAGASSVGFLTCSYDYIESGMVKAICDALPFDVIGCTTLTNANEHEAGTMLLCLTVLSADDCRFSAAVTEPLGGGLAGKVASAVAGAKARLDGPPGMTLAMLPFYGEGGAVMLDTLDKELGGSPIFGTVACDADTAEYSNTYVIYNGEHYKDRIALYMASGNINPRFVVASTSEQNLRKQQAVITSSEGCLLRQVNNMPAGEYFESVGLMSGKGVEGMSSVPFVVDYGDGTQPVARAIYGINEDGSAVCGGLMPEGSTLYIGRMDVEDILATAENSIQNLLKKGDVNGLILLPCLGRNMVLAMDPLAEIDVVRNQVGSGVPWHLAYSAGECCPVYGAKIPGGACGTTENRFHNFTFIGCAV